MPGIISDAWNWATTPPEFVKKRAQKAYESVGDSSVFDTTLEKYGKPAIKAGIRMAESSATPLDAAGLLAGGAGFAGAEIANQLRRLPRIPNMEHYLDAIRLGKTHPEAVKIASSGGRRAADKSRMAEDVEEQSRAWRSRQTPSPSQATPTPTTPTPTASKYPNAVSRSMADMVEAEEERARAVRNTAGRGKSSIIDLAEAVRKNARRPYAERGEALMKQWKKEARGYPYRSDY